MNERLKGVWVAMPTPWQADGTVDSGVVRELVARYAAAGLDGAYTTGTDGEVHVMETHELTQLVRPFAEAETIVSEGCRRNVISRVAESSAIACSLWVSGSRSTSRSR